MNYSLARLKKREKTKITNISLDPTSPLTFSNVVDSLTIAIRKIRKRSKMYRYWKGTRLSLVADNKKYQRFNKILEVCVSIVCHFPV